MNIESVKKEKFTTRKSLVLKSCRILGFHSECYIQEIRKMDFYLPHVNILGENNCADKRYDMFES